MTPSPAWTSTPVVFLASVAVLFIGMNPALNLYDEGLVLVGAARVYNGEVPYRDFWTMYGPGQFYLTSLLYSLFGISDLVLRFSDIAAKAAIVALAYVIVGRLAPERHALAAAFAVLLLLIGTQIHGFPVFPALAMALAAVLCLDRGITSQKASMLAAAGALTGLETTFRHDLGAYTAAACVLVLAANGFASAEGGRPGDMLRSAASTIGAYAAGLMLVIVPVAGLLFSSVSLADLTYSLIEVPAMIYPGVRALPFPGFPSGVETNPPYRAGLAEYSVYLPFLVIAWASFLEVRRIREARSHGASWMKCFDGGGPIVALLILMNLLFTLKGLVRVSAIHMVQSLVLSIMIVAVMAGRLNWRRRNDQISLLPALAVTALLLVVPAFKGLKAFGAGISRVIATENSLVSRCIFPPLPRLRCVSIDGDALAAAQYVLSNTRDGDAIYAGAGHHDRLFVNAMATYFAAERRPATKWHELHPGVQTTAAVQSAMVAEFKVNAPKLVLLDERWDKIEEPNASRLSSGVTLLDDYIRANFTETKRFGSIRVMAPRRAGSDVSILVPIRGARLAAR